MCAFKTRESLAGGITRGTRKIWTRIKRIRRRRWRRRRRKRRRRIGKRK